MPRCCGRFWWRRRSLLGTRHGARFAGRTVVITGGSSGLGLALGRELAARGARLVLIARNRPRLQGAMRQILEHQPAAVVRTLPVDVSDGGAVQAAFAGLERIDLLINSAGILREGHFETLPESVFRELLEINLLGAVNATRAALPQLRRARGAIVNVASAAGLTGVFGYTAYCASKHALVGFSEALRYELHGRDVSVHTVCPGEFDSPMVAALDRARSPQNRAHTLTIPKTSLDTIVAETLRGLERRRPLIVPGRRTRAAVGVARLAPALTREIGLRRIAAA